FSLVHDFNYFEFLLDNGAILQKIPHLVKRSSSSLVDSPIVQHQESSSQDIEVDLENLSSDPGLRPNTPNLIEQVHRAYLLKGPCQPRKHDFPQKVDGN